VFYLACMVGLVVNLALSRMLLADGFRWYLASAAGLAVGSVWNYWISSFFVWRINRRRAQRYPIEPAMTGANSAL
jgi:putative flippase GtrA